jgi:Phage integrase, N-terminal SAM-like domain
VFLPGLGPLQLSAITPKHVQAAVNARAKEAAPSTLARDFSALRAVLNAAVDAGSHRPISCSQDRPTDRQDH